MSFIYSMCDDIRDALENECELVKNVVLTLNTKQKKKQQIPGVLVHPSAVVVCMKFESCYKDNTNQLIPVFRRVLNFLSERLDISINSFLMCGYNETNEENDMPAFLYTYNAYNDRIGCYEYDDQATDFIYAVLNEVSCRRSVFTLDKISDVVFQLQLIGGSNGEVKKDREGNYYIKKHGRWFLASEHDPDDFFKRAAYFGAFGAHKFTDQKKAVGLLYFFTCGCFGIGWLFDCFLILFGMYKDSEGKYLLPVSNFKNCFLKIGVGLCITLAYIALYVFIFRFFGDFFNKTLETTISSQDIK